MKKNILHLLFFILPFIGVAQNYAPKDYYLIDSLDLNQLSEEDKELLEESLKIFHSANEDTSRINALSNICENMNHDDWSKYQFYQYQIIEKALKKSNSSEVNDKLTVSLSGALNNLGIIYEIKGDVKKAINCYKKSITIDKKRNDKKGVALTLNNLGFVYDKQGDIPKALEIYHQSLKFLEENKDKYGMGVTLNNIGLIYKYQGDSSKALDYLNRSLKLREELGDKSEMANALNNIGLVYGVNDKALEIHKKSLQLRQEAGDKYGSAFSYINIGNIYLLQNKALESIEFFQKSLDLRKEIGDKSGIAISLNHIGRANLILGDTEEAKINIENSLKIAQEIGYPTEIQSAAELLSKLYEEKFEYSNSLKMYKLFIQMRDSLNNEETQKAAAKQQAQYEYEKQKP